MSREDELSGVEQAFLLFMSIFINSYMYLFAKVYTYCIQLNSHLVDGTVFANLSEHSNRTQKLV